MTPKKILATRRISDAEVERAKEHDVAIEQIDFIQIHPCANRKQIENYVNCRAEVVFTSQNAVTIVSTYLHGRKPDWKLFCIHGATEDQVAEAFGRERIVASANSAEQLADEIVGKTQERKVIFFCGEKRRDELPDALKKNDIEVEEVTIYDTKLSPEEVMQHYDGIAFFSPTAVESYFSANVVDDKTIFFAIGPTTAGSLTKFAKNRVVTAAEPSEKSMIDAILQEVKQSDE